MLTRRDRAVVGGLLLVLVLLASAVAWPSLSPAATPSPSPSPSPTVARAYREGMLGRPTSVSPFAARTAADRALVALVFSGLVRLGPDETLEPDLAERWTVDPAGAVYTFTLRSDARWHDGEPVTAADVAFTIRTLQDPTYTGPGGASWRDVTVTAIDDRTIRFELSNPLGGFLLAATQPIAPAHLLEGIPPERLATDPFGQQPVGSGPYRLLSWNASEASLEAVIPGTDYGAVDSTAPPADSLASPSPTATPSRPLPYLASLELRFFTQPAGLAAAYRDGDLDAAVGLPPTEASTLASGPGSRLLRYPRATLTGVVFDLRPTRREFQDPRSRLALLQAIDRDAIVATELAGLGVRADAPIPPSSWAFDAAKSPPLAADPMAAAKGLAAAGWKRLKDGGWAAPGTTQAYTIELISPDADSNPAAAAVAAAIADDWRAIGMTVDLVALPPPELVGERLAAGRFAVAVLDVMVGLDPDLYPLLASTQTLTGGSNVSGLQDATLDTKLVAARRPGDEASRKAAYADLQGYLSANQFLLPIAWRDEVVVLREDVIGPSVRPLGDTADRYYDVLTWRLADDR
jgi:peptide/nickel transport system substrate-binding protein